MPLILTHGFPDSYTRFLELIPLLTDPARHGADADDSFDVVVPSLPWCAFSQDIGTPVDCSPSTRPGTSS